VQSSTREAVADRGRSLALPLLAAPEPLGRIRGWVAGAAATESGWGEGGGGDAGEESRGWLGSEPRLEFGAWGRPGGIMRGSGSGRGCSQKRVGVCKMTSTSSFGFFGYKEI
jgi:hypothetical protein